MKLRLLDKKDVSSEERWFNGRTVLYLFGWTELGVGLSTKELNWRSEETNLREREY